MYNEERKKEFINSNQSNNVLDSVFRISSDLETALEKDICDFSLDELIFFYQTMGSVYYYTLSAYKSTLSAYVEWCIKKGYCKENHVKQLTAGIIIRMISEMGISEKIISREIFLEEIKTIPTARMKYVLLMLFETGGKNNFQDIFEAKLENLHGNELHLEDRVVRVSDELVSIIYQAVEEDEVPWSNTMRPLVDTGHILKEYVVKDYSLVPTVRYKRMYAAIKKTLDSYCYGISLMDVVSSGMISFIRTLAKENNMIPFDVVLDPKLYQIVKNQYNINRTAGHFLNQYRSCLN